MNNQLSYVIAGTMSWGLSRKNLNVIDCSKLLLNYFEQYINTFDLADIYGAYTTEELFGNALKYSNINRNNIIIISKCGIAYPFQTNNFLVKHYDYSKDYIIKAVERSLKFIQTDYLDILLLHRPSPLLIVDEVAEAYLYLFKNGMIKEIGVFNFLPLQIDLLNKYIPIKYNQLQFSVTKNQSFIDGTFDHHQLYQMQPMAWNPTGDLYKLTLNQDIKNNILKLCELKNWNPDLILLAWIIKHPAHILPVIGTTNINRINQLNQLNNIIISTEEWFQIYTIFLNKNVP
jgi:predicted oxidoreductase